MNLGWSLQFFPSGWQHVVHAALCVVPILVMAVLWWWLATAVAQSRNQEVFAVASARRLTVAGGVIALGGPVLALANRARLAEITAAPRRLVGRKPVIVLDDHS